MEQRKLRQFRKILSVSFITFSQLTFTTYCRNLPTKWTNEELARNSYHCITVSRTHILTRIHVSTTSAFNV